MISISFHFSFVLNLPHALQFFLRFFVIVCGERDIVFLGLSLLDGDARSKEVLGLFGLFGLFAIESE